MNAQYDMAIEVQHFGATNMLKATCRDLPTLKVVGTDEADLLECLPAVITSMLEALGQVRSVTLNGSDLSNLRAHVA